MSMSTRCGPAIAIPRRRPPAADPPPTLPPDEDDDAEDDDDHADDEPSREGIGSRRGLDSRDAPDSGRRHAPPDDAGSREDLDSREDADSPDAAGPREDLDSCLDADSPDDVESPDEAGTPGDGDSLAASAGARARSARVAGRLRVPGEPTPRGRVRLQKAMTMAALAAILALGGVFGLRPRLAEATPRTLGVAAARADGPVTTPAAGDGSRAPAPPPRTTTAPAQSGTSSSAPVAAGPSGSTPAKAASAATAGPDTDVSGGDAAAATDGTRAPGGKRVTGRLNLNTATAEQLMLLPGVGPAKADRVITWRRRNGTFHRVADLRRVKGFGYRTVKRLEPNLDIQGDTTLRAGGG
ncbi:MAG TPA: helix-hairpin-helix domain-containing protein [Kofleriaceae bacterium]|nr:helix-hairpin-helix domain-containing protein [Kofleriaceae bacterium]